VTTAPINYPIEYGVIAAYLLLMVSIGFVFRSFNKNSGDFFRGGSQATWWMVGMSSFMSGVSAVTFTGNGGAAYEAGWSVIAIYLGNFAGMVIQALLLAPWFRQLRATTFPEIIHERFGLSTQQVFAYINICTFTIYAALWLFGLAVFSSAVFALPVHIVIPVLGVVALFYSTMGGKWAVLAADFVQGLIMMSMCVLISVLCLVKLGGIDGFFTRIGEMGLSETFALIKPSGEGPKAIYTSGWFWAAFIMSVIFNCGAGNAVKFFAVKDGKEARLAATMSAIMMLAGVIFWFIPPMTARLLYAPIVDGVPIRTPSEAAFAITSMQLLPNGLIGMMVVAMFSATMSSMDVGINGNAAIVVKDVIPPIRRLLKLADASETTLLRWGRIATLFCGVVIVLLAEYLSMQKEMGIFELMINFGAVVTIPITIPTVLCIFIHRAPGWSAIFSIICSAAVPVCAMTSGDSWSFQERTLLTVVVGAVSFIATMPFWRMTSPAYRERVNRFFKKMHTPVDFEHEVGPGSDRRQLTLMGRFTLVVATFVTMLLFLPNAWSGRLCILTLALGMGVVGSLLCHAGKKHKDV
jgi:Na+/proline symporter